MMQSPAPVPRPAPAGLDPRRWWVLALLCGAFFMVLLDGTITIVALPSIAGRDRPGAGPPAPRPAAESSARTAGTGPGDRRPGLKRPAPPTAV
jgi:hypothetical protein